jgi:hypothetical protein
MAGMFVTLLSSILSMFPFSYPINTAFPFGAVPKQDTAISESPVTASQRETSLALISYSETPFPKAVYILPFTDWIVNP